MKYTINKTLKGAALSGLAALVLGCGGGGGGGKASEAGGRAQIRTRLVADKNAGKIDDWNESIIEGGIEESLLRIGDTDLYPDFVVFVTGDRDAYIEYTSPTDSQSAAQNEISILYNAYPEPDRLDYLYTGPSSASAVGTAVDSYSSANFIGQIPTP